MPIALMCGLGDKLASPHDYMWLRDELANNKNCIFFKEYNCGHLAFLMPGNKSIFHDMFVLMKRYNPLFRPQAAHITQEIREAEQAAAINIANMTMTQGAFHTNGGEHRLNIIDDYL